MPFAPNLLLPLALIALGASTASAHTRIKPGASLIPRSTSSGEKTGPCGVTPATTDPLQRTALVAGQSLKVSWEETINHVSHFRIAFSPDGSTGFDTHVLLDNLADNQTGTVNYVDPTTYHQFSATITVPKTPCESCSLQVIQVMLDNIDMPSNYYSCADIRIVPVGQSTAAPAPMAPAPATPAPPVPVTPIPTAVPAAVIPATPQHVKLLLQPASTQAKP